MADGVFVFIMISVKRNKESYKKTKVNLSNLSNMSSDIF